MGSLSHHASVYTSDEEFLAMALPFVTEGIDRGESVLVTTTGANLELVASALGPRASAMDHAESAYFGRRTVQRVAAFDRYWRRAAASAPNERVRVLAEPVWIGKSSMDIAAWHRMEAGLNVVLADTAVWMICPYDARIHSPAVLAEARRTHPAMVVGTEIWTSDEYVDPIAYALASDQGALPDPPRDPLALDFDHDLQAVRSFVANGAVTCGLAGERVSLLALAAGEVATYLAQCGGISGTVRMWPGQGTVTCELAARGAHLDDPYVGFRPPGTGPPGTEGMWVANQLCERLAVRPLHPEGGLIRLDVLGPRSEELLQTGEPYTT